MGCFMSACAVTGRTIQHKDKIVAFVVSSAERWRSTPDEIFLIHPWDKCSLISMPIFGYYDDYGSIEPDDTNATAIENLKAIFPNSNILDEDGSTIDHKFLREKVVAYDSKEYNVGLMMILRDTYDYLMSKYKHDGRERLEVVLNEYHSIDENENYYEFSKMNHILTFSADHDIIYKYGRNDPSDYRSPNKLRALNIMDVSGPMHKLARHLAYKQHVTEIPDNYYELFDLWSQTQALMDAFDQLGVQVSPVLYMGQDNNLGSSIELHLNTLYNLLNRIGEDEIEFGLSYDYHTKKEWSEIDKYQTMLDEFHKKITAKLAEHKANCLYEEDEDD